MKIVHIKRAFRSFSDKFKESLLKALNGSHFSNIIIKLIPYNNSGCEKRVSEVFMFNIK